VGWGPHLDHGRHRHGVYIVGQRLDRLPSVPAAAFDLLVDPVFRGRRAGRLDDREQRQRGVVPLGVADPVSERIGGGLATVGGHQDRVVHASRSLGAEVSPRRTRANGRSRRSLRPVPEDEHDVGDHVQPHREDVEDVTDDEQVSERERRLDADEQRHQRGDAADGVDHPLAPAQLRVPSVVEGDREVAARRGQKPGLPVGVGPYRGREGAEGSRDVDTTATAIAFKGALRTSQIRFRRTVGAV